MAYFSLIEAADRYDKYRPKVHNIIIDWLTESGIELDFDRSVDVACGTGESTIPLTKISKETIGIDTSKEMLAKAQEKGLSIENISYETLHELGKFDLISTCMAFHWFNEHRAIKSYKLASNNGAIWLVYNFVFKGNIDSENFNNWFYEQYLKEYPSPKRGVHFATVDVRDLSIERISSNEGYIPISLTKRGLIKYLTTQSNVEHAVIQGTPYKQIEKNIISQLSKFEHPEIY